jgi:hypothetical protein
MLVVGASMKRLASIACRMSARLTADPTVVIEDERPGYVRYRRDDGRRWEVRGACDRRGDCLVGAVIDGVFVPTRERAHELALAYQGLDSPVLPGFSGCCPLKGTWL